MTELPEMLTKSEVIKTLNCSLSSFDKMLAQGKFPKGARFGGRQAQWPKATVVKWMTDRIEAAGLTT